MIIICTDCLRAVSTEMEPNPKGGPDLFVDPCWKHREKLVSVRVDIYQDFLKRMIADLARTNRLDKVTA